MIINYFSETETKYIIHLKYIDTTTGVRVRACDCFQILKNGDKGCYVTMSSQVLFASTRTKDLKAKDLDRLLEAEPGSARIPDEARKFILQYKIKLLANDLGFKIEFLEFIKSNPVQAREFFRIIQDGVFHLEPSSELEDLIEENRTLFTNLELLQEHHPDTFRIYVEALQDYIDIIAPTISRYLRP